MGVIDDHFGGYGFHSNHTGTYGCFGHQDWFDISDYEEAEASARRRKRAGKQGGKPVTRKGQKNAVVSRKRAAADSSSDESPGGRLNNPPAAAPRRSARVTGGGDAKATAIAILDSSADEDSESSLSGSGGDSRSGGDSSSSDSDGSGTTTSDADGADSSETTSDADEDVVVPAAVPRGVRRGSQVGSAADTAAHLLVEQELQSGAPPQLAKFRVVELQAYLKAAGVRATGLKAELILRAQAHHALLSCPDGARVTHPESSFTYDCTGDACKGDVVLFKQAVYDRFDVGTRHGKLLGYRTVAGTIVKESYGSERQQHTFTLEVLWSTGVQPRKTLETLLIKGRNLYKRRGGFGVRRRPWDDEALRREVLGEKHERGDAARAVRRGGRPAKRACLSHLGPVPPPRAHHSTVSHPHPAQLSAALHLARTSGPASTSHPPPQHPSHPASLHPTGMSQPPGRGQSAMRSGKLQLNPHAAAYAPQQSSTLAGFAPRAPLAVRQLNGQGLGEHAFPHSVAAAQQQQAGPGPGSASAMYNAAANLCGRNAGTLGTTGGMFGGAGDMFGAAGGTNGGAFAAASRTSGGAGGMFVFRAAGGMLGTNSARFGWAGGTSRMAGGMFGAASRRYGGAGVTFGGGGTFSGAGGAFAMDGGTFGGAGGISGSANGTIDTGVRGSRQGFSRCWWDA